MRIAVCGTKGGSGKSTLAGLLALCFADSEKYVSANDCDPQATLTTWLRSIGGESGKIAPETTTLGRLKGNNDKGYYSFDPTIHITDFPPASPDVLIKMLHIFGDKKELQHWDIILVPCRPAVADIWSIRSFLDKLEGYNGKVRLVMNALDNSSISKAGSLDSLLEGIKTPRLKASLSRRACYSYAMVSGWKALDEKAKSEVLSLALEISR